LTGRLDGFISAFDQVVQVTGAMGLDFSIRVAGIIKHLHFRTSLPGILIFIRFLYIVYDTTISAWSNFPIQSEFIIFVGAHGDDIPTIGGLPAALWILFGREVNGFIIDDPAGANGFFSIIAPALQRLTIKQ